MRRRTLQAALVTLATFVFVAGPLWVLSLFSGLFTVEIAGQRVRRQTSWYFHQLGLLPYPFSKMAVCYAYWDQQHHKIFHGPCDNFDEKGRLTMRSHYVDGKLTGPSIVFDEAGQPTSASYWKDDKRIGDASYRGGELYSSREIAFDARGEGIMEKFFYDNKWSLRFKCGVPQDREINEKTGEVRLLAEALPPASNCLKEVRLDY